MRILGVNDSSHDAAVSVVDDGKIVFASHGERYNKNKNSFSNPDEIFEEALSFGKPDVIAYFETRSKKRFRKTLWGGVNGEYKNLYKKTTSLLDGVPEVQLSHHFSHACAGYFTSTFDEATIVVIDAIGEMETATVWHAQGGKIAKKYSLKYPVSFGLFYSAFTDLLGLRAGTEEYIMMGMAAYGDPSRYYKDVSSYFPTAETQKYNLHQGIRDWKHPIETDQDKFDIAAAAQKVYEERLREFMYRVRKTAKSMNLVFMGGCALNCSANTMLLGIWEEVWIMPNPGDAGSSLGAALAVHGEHVRWRGPYLGRDIAGEYPIEPILHELKTKGIVGVAVGRAEFGPRAFGNRSILADPRKPEFKDLVNTVKRREPFRPFAPVVMEDYASDWFDIDRPVPYMQFAVRCKQHHLVPAVVHGDGTSRVQTVNPYQHFGLYEVLSRWNESTGVPVLLNTSLNIKNQPLLNDEFDKEVWRKMNPSVVLL